MGRLSSDRWLGLGSAITSLGATATVAFWIYTLEAPGDLSFWTLPGIASLMVLAIGLILLLVGFLSPSPTETLLQQQRGGEGSTNVQAGGDIRIARDE